jgi:hypothetical protein
MRNNHKLKNKQAKIATKNKILSSMKIRIALSNPYYIPELMECITVKYNTHSKRYDITVPVQLLTDYNNNQYRGNTDKMIVAMAKK